MMSEFKKKHVILNLSDESESQSLAKKLAHCIKAPVVITFSGDIGTGKTTIIRALLKNMGVNSPIKSPTFSLVESYQSSDALIHHFDLYRIVHEEELDYLGFRDYFTEQSICCIEWAEHAGKSLPKVDIRFKLSIKGAGRELQISAESVLGESVLACLVGDL